MNHIILDILLITVLISCKETTSYNLAYEKGNKVYATSRDTMIKKSFSNVTNPCISPDGKSLAVTKFANAGSGRSIIIIDLESMKEIQLNVKNDNYYGPSWSPDNQYLAFNIFINYNWTIGLVNSKNYGFTFVKTANKFGLFSPTWIGDGKHFVCHDMRKIFIFDLHCNPTDSIDIEKTMGNNYFIGSNSKFLFTSDNNFIIFNSGINEFMKDVEGPVEAIFSFNLSNNSIKRLSPKGLYSTDPFIETDNNILFTGSKENEHNSNIYRTSLTNGKLDLVIKNAMTPSVSNQ
jgi:Tol biopolymer transport system component